MQTTNLPWHLLSHYLFEYINMNVAIFASLQSVIFWLHQVTPLPLIEGQVVEGHISLWVQSWPCNFLSEVRFPRGRIHDLTIREKKGELSVFEASHHDGQEDVRSITNCKVLYQQGKYVSEDIVEVEESKIKVEDKDLPKMKHKAEWVSEFVDRKNR